MRSRTPKVLHAAAGRSLLGHVLTSVREISPARVVVVVGAGRDKVVAHLAETAPEALPVVQERQGGTGHAVRTALEALPDLTGTVVVTAGDTPLLSPATLQALVGTHAATGAAATVLTALLDDPTGYGRVLRDPAGNVAAIVEHRDATPEELAVHEINSGIYAFAADHLRSALAQLTTDNAQGEEYLTDVLAILREQARPVAAVVAPDALDVAGVNDRSQLALAGAALRDRLLLRWMRAGVTVVDPLTTWVDADVELAPDVTLLPGVRLHGRTSVAAGAVVGPDTTLVDTEVGADAVVRSSTCEGARIGERATVGPYTFLRPGTVLGAGAKAGGFVEMKNAVLGQEAKVPHLSYVGDAEVGDGTNVGAATIFANYDGVAKHRTTVGAHVRIGSDTVLVAPVTVGDGAYTAAGSVVTDDVPPGALAIGRSRQGTVDGWVERRRSGTSSAQAAQEARRAAPDGGGGNDGDGIDSEGVGR
ncbi:bifunctional UDP-N-acetylglucosamine diphosphorylase/glucosamine-1-phosphate N-acetyltransferase GlmU [Motilibacter aurantiacus]|uniref:bifunctional UDP-N-acetylglucosamine diphosphorylase/glucosamine-1-phosphate N-acetyltransferase GlmU n=1 Tax=Motilibacter aurantiacus TaxID=2714955 RepID=UPI001E53283A